MPYRLKKFIGMLILVFLTILTALLSVTIASFRLAESPWYIHFAFFGTAIVAWVLLSMLVISWMERRKAD